MTENNNNNKTSYYDDTFWEYEPVEAKASRDDLEKYLNLVSRTYTNERSKDAFKPYLQFMIVVSFVSFLLVFTAGYYSIPDGEPVPMPFASNDQQSTFANKLEFAFILGISAVAATAIVFAALGGHAIQSQNDRLSALSDEMDHIRDRIASIELEEAIRKREIKRGSQQLTSDQFYTEISRDIQENFQTKRYDQALRRIEHALEHSPIDSRLWHYKGIALGKGGNFRDALAAFDVSSQINASDPVLWYNKAVAFAGMKEYKEAVKSLDKALELNPKDTVTQEFRNRINRIQQLSESDPTDYRWEFRLPS